jgi:predicted transcriptional regulator
MASVTATMSAISDEKALSLFRTVALSEDYDNRNLLRKLRLRFKEYYSIRKKLIDAGLIEQTNGKYQLTPIGKVVFSAQAKVEVAIENYWKLKALDSIVMSAGKTRLVAEEYGILIDKLIDN